MQNYTSDIQNRQYAEQFIENYVPTFINVFKYEIILTFT